MKLAQLTFDFMRFYSAGVDDTATFIIKDTDGREYALKSNAAHYRRGTNTLTLIIEPIKQGEETDEEKTD